MSKDTIEPNRLRRFQLFNDGKPIRVDTLLSFQPEKMREAWRVELLSENLLHFLAENALRKKDLYAESAEEKLQVNVRVVQDSYCLEVLFYKTLADANYGGDAQLVRSWGLVAVGEHKQRPGFILEEIQRGLDVFLKEHGIANETASLAT